eukprot:768216-Hanusia_phi.AAC.1
MFLLEDSPSARILPPSAPRMDVRYLISSRSSSSAFSISGTVRVQYTSLGTSGRHLQHAVLLRVEGALELDHVVALLLVDVGVGEVDGRQIIEERESGGGRGGEEERRWEGRGGREEAGEEGRKRGGRGGGRRGEEERRKRGGGIAEGGRDGGSKDGEKGKQRSLSTIGNSKDSKNISTYPLVPSKFADRTAVPSYKNPMAVLWIALAAMMAGTAEAFGTSLLHHAPCRRQVVANPRPLLQDLRPAALKRVKGAAVGMAMMGEGREKMPLATLTKKTEWSMAIALDDGAELA